MYLHSHTLVPYQLIYSLGTSYDSYLYFCIVNGNVGVATMVEYSFHSSEEHTLSGPVEFTVVQHYLCDHLNFKRE